MNIFDEPKIDCHNHIFDPVRFPYDDRVAYHPSGHEISTAEQLFQLFDAYGLNYALVVGPNSGYATDNRCLLDAIKRSDGRLKGIAVVENNTELSELQRLKEAGIMGVAFNTSALGIEYYMNSHELIKNLEKLDMFLQVQFEGDEVLPLMPLLENSSVRLLIDHCGRPILKNGIEQLGFQSVLKLGKTRRANIKLSGYEKFSNESAPYSDAWPYVYKLVEAFGIDNCIWGSDWPFLRAPERIDYGTLLKVVERLFPDKNDRSKVLYDNAFRLFDFGNNY
nr:amidohydrolase family protein [Sedimentibacter sp.]